MFNIHRVGHDLVAVYRVVSSQRDLEYMSATVHDTEPVLVIGACDIGHRDIKVAVFVASAAEPLRLAPDSINATGPLLECCRIPREVVVDHVAAFAVEVYQPVEEVCSLSPAVQAAWR